MKISKRMFIGFMSTAVMLPLVACGQQNKSDFNVSDDSHMIIEEAESLQPETEPEAVAETTELDMNYMNLEGEYMDSYSQRAQLSTAYIDSDLGLAMIITWSNSAFESQRWIMNAAFDENGKLSYTNCMSGTITTDENGENTFETSSEDGSGYFTVEDGKLIWDGAEDENCRNCVFEKMPSDYMGE